jgi:UDP-N-acetylglucosamine transferase subunit ALG13
VIFATVGSHPTFAFERLLAALESLPAGEELIVQHGPGSPPANADRAVAWMPYGEFEELLARADRVIAHAGAGTILCAARAGHVPVVMPRLGRLGETVDDHQLDFARGLARDGGVILAEDATDLAAAVAAVPPRGDAAAERGAELVAAVRAELVAAGLP